ELPAKSNRSYDNGSDFVDSEFTHAKKPGWFFLGSVQEAAAPSGVTRRTLYNGAATLIEKTGSFKEPKGCALPESPNWEAVEVPAAVGTDVLGVQFLEGDNDVLFFATSVEADRPVKGSTTINLDGIDFQSDFDPSDGDLRAAHSKTDWYFPRFRYRYP